MTRHIAGLAAVLPQYDGLIVDLWGVMHNGEGLFPEAVQALEVAKAAGKSLTFLSNAPRRRAEAQATLTGRLGLDPRLIDQMVTSGEVAWQAIAAGTTAAWGPKAYFFGAPKDTHMQNGLPHVTFVDTVAQADWILNIGPEQGHQDLATFDPLIDQALARHLPMVCANPDLVVRRGQNWELCAGSIAQAYADQGGEVVWYGKPHTAVYNQVLKAAGQAPKRLLAIGDSFKTDIRGALRHGIDVLYVNTGIHSMEIGQPLDPQRLAQVAKAHDAWPTYAAERLQV